MEEEIDWVRYVLIFKTLFNIYDVELQVKICPLTPAVEDFVLNEGLKKERLAFTQTQEKLLTNEFHVNHQGAILAGC